MIFLTIKMLTDRRGPLQGVDVESIVKTAYGPHARYVEDTEGESLGLIVKPSPGYDPTVLDSVIDLHETDG